LIFDLTRFFDHLVVLTFLGHAVGWPMTSSQLRWREGNKRYLDDFDDSEVDAVVTASEDRTVEQFDQEFEDRFSRVDLLVFVLVDQVALDHQRHARYHLNHRHGTWPTRVPSVFRSSYLRSCLTRVSDMTSRRRLRPSTSHRLDVPPVRLSAVGRRAFPVSGASVWNDLPLHVASVPSLAVFPFLPRYYHLTRVLLSPFITTVWTPVVLAIINII